MTHHEESPMSESLTDTPETLTARAETLETEGREHLYSAQRLQSEVGSMLVESDFTADIDVQQGRVARAQGLLISAGQEYDHADQKLDVARRYRKAADAARKAAKPTLGRTLMEALWPNQADVVWADSEHKREDAERAAEAVVTQFLAENAKSLWQVLDWNAYGTFRDREAAKTVRDLLRAHEIQHP